MPSQCIGGYKLIQCYKNNLAIYESQKGKGDILNVNCDYLMGSFIDFLK